MFGPAIPQRWRLKAYCATALLTFAFGTVTQAQARDACCTAATQAAASYNYILGTQAFGGNHNFAKDTTLLDQAREIRALGSNVLKISLGKRQAGKYGFGDAAARARTELDYVKAARGLQQTLDLDFKYYQFWVQTFTDADWHHGVSKADAKLYYNEVYDLTAWLLKRYTGTGKVFLLGNWEGDWMLNGGQGKDVQPTPEAVKGMIDWLNIRQKAIDDAKAATPHDGVEVYHYVEVNLVKRALEGKPSVALSVLPATNVDLVSYSSYEAIKQSPTPDIGSIRQPLTQLVRYLEGQLKPKPGLPFNHRVFIGEYGYHANGSMPLTVEQQYLKSRYVMQIAIELDLPFALIWQFYNNEYAPNGTSHEMSLVDETGEKRALYYLLQQYLKTMTAFVADGIRQSGAVPARDAFRAKALEVLATFSFEKMQRMANTERKAAATE
ncbi:hypothetical protein QH494_11580 [Sphingomonas sp. AR_OL41]|uniref:hypothetical protein n=1 Tax=Sphingomonas sp. AR_OL41 TaxID=3042729 RepID=UPI0024815838|nr:hypothetical protein [Sphingomonas sp. AR_OL41]MDH7972826.1 hypothetical protein [Sphingomonas sp. AR_OL41]